MILSCAIAVLAASGQLAAAAPRDPVRLVKTSEEDPGQWVTEQEKWELFTSRGVGFIDITDIKDERVLENLSTKPTGRISTQAAAFPTELSHVEEANELIAASGVEGPQSWLETLAAYHTRHYQSQTGQEAAQWLFETVAEVASANPKIVVTQFEHSFNQPSVIARIPGTSENLVIVGAHYDSTTGSATSRAPGADDDASGSVVVLESLRVLAEAGFAPEATIEFHWYGGEEAGLLGSADVFADYSAQGMNVTSYLNQDMAGYSPAETPTIIEDYTDAGLNEYMALIITEFVGQAPNRDECGYGCSDHASANANGFPAAFVFEAQTDETSPYIHTPEDLPSTIMWDVVRRHIVMTIGYLVEASYL
ncbi:hypothetical protein S40285_02435 [Stachybotrys chlorohalonatus IBT 40285]|uniref:Peptide hydrolase n=1 Tax=Stachybotrys chlorohalonatus (strain IBT 40285) TaxID=1283841 RepID=A0A084R0T9_STAC4|nr:hypothetical protein S40285_02435 [Stachybotrys chlorohalonata IBT 40285]